MPIKTINSQGTKLYLVDQPSTPWANCGAAVAALRAGSKIVCPQSLGEINESRAVTEYKCLSSNESSKALGAVSRSSFDVQVILDPEDRLGQFKLQGAFRDNTPLIMGIEYEGVMLYFNIGVSSIGTSIEQDSAIITKFTIEISSDIKECKTSAAHAQSDAVVNNGIIIVNGGIPIVDSF